MFYKDGWKMVERERSGVKMWLSDRKAEHEEVLKESQIKDRYFLWIEIVLQGRTHRAQESQETYKSQESQ